MISEKNNWEESMQEQEDAADGYTKIRPSVGRLNVDFTQQERERQQQYSTFKKFSGKVENCGLLCHHHFFSFRGN